MCVAYKLDGKELDEPPTDPDDLVARRAGLRDGSRAGARCRADAHDVTDLPAPARAYVETIERMAGVPFCLVSVGPDRSRDHPPTRSFRLTP